MTPLFALLLVIPSQAQMPEGPAFDRLRGEEFDRVQVEWIADCTGPLSLDRVLPRREVHLVRELAAPHYECRWFARRALADMGDDAVPALCWGMRSRYIEVRDACKALWYRRGRCATCEGSGDCPECRDWTAERRAIGDPCRCDHARRCPECHGSGDLRWLWSGTDELGDIYVPRNLFGGTRLHWQD